MSSLPQKSPYDDKPEDGGTPMLPGENSSSATSEPGVPGPRYGDHIITISLEDLKDKSKSFAKTATIDKTETVASYNCQHSDATGSQPTILVPGTCTNDSPYMVSFFSFSFRVKIDTILCHQRRRTRLA